MGEDRESAEGGGEKESLRFKVEGIRYKAEGVR